MHNMSASQDQYINSLKKIKQVEEDAQKEIDSYKSKIEDQIIQLDSELEKAIAAAKSEGEKLVDSNVEKATKKANAIENVFIPRLESAVKFITFRLEEMERDTFAMLKTVKRKMDEREKNVEVEVIAN